MTRTVLDKEARRQQLLEAAITVFARKGYRETSIDDVIREAEVARGTFYLYFGGKKELFLAIIDYYFALLSKLFKILAERVDRLLGKEPHVRLSRSWMQEHLLVWMQFFVRYRNLSKLIFREANAIDAQFEERWNHLRESQRSLLVRSAVQLQAAGQFRRAIDPRSFSLFLGGMFHATVCDYILLQPDPDLSWLAEQWVEFLLHGILPTEGG